MADYNILMLYKGFLVSIPVKSLAEVEYEGAVLLEQGFKKPAFREEFQPVNGVIVKRELHEKKTKKGEPMYLWTVKQEVSGEEHKIVGFKPDEYAKGDNVRVSMGQYGKTATRLSASAWDEQEDDKALNDDIPF